MEPREAASGAGNSAETAYHPVVTVELHPTCSPGGDPARVRVVAVGEGRTALSVQREARNSLPIVRGQGPPFVVAERDGRLVRVVDQAMQRAGFLPVRAAPGRDSHLARFAAEHPHRAPLSVVGCGNLLCNRGVLATTSAGDFGVAGPSGPAFVLDDGAAITGPALVIDGRPATIEPAQYADLRHLLLPAWVEVAAGVRVDFGLDRLAADPLLLERAVRGEVVEFELSESLPANDAHDALLVPHAISVDALRLALRLKGYREVGGGSAVAGRGDVIARGDFRLTPEVLAVRFLRGVYPHHALARDRHGVAWSVLVAGRSNREGATVEDYAAALAAAGAREAVLLDNGGDVGLLLRASEDVAAPLPWTSSDPAVADWRFEITPAEADRANSWPLRACVIRHR